MTARTHDAFAFASLITAATFYPPQSLNLATTFSSLVGNVVGALIPDMDQASNRLWDLMPAGNYVGKIFRKLFLQHRTLSHSLLGVFLIYKFLEWFLPKILNPGFIDIKTVFASIMIGYLSHLLADSLTKEGLPLLFPFSFKIGIPPVKFLRVTTGSWIENFVILPGVAIYLVWFIGNHRGELIRLINLVQN